MNGTVEQQGFFGWDPVSMETNRVGREAVGIKLGKSTTGNDLTKPPTSTIAPIFQRQRVSNAWT